MKSEYEVEDIVAVFHKKKRRLFKVKWAGYTAKQQHSWVPEHSLLQDGHHSRIKKFWDDHGLNPTKAYYPDQEGRPRCWMCGWSCKPDRPWLLRGHITRSRHDWNRKRAHTTAKKDVKADKLKDRQKELDTVKWGKKAIQNCWQFIYLGSVFQCDGDHMPDVQRRIAMERTRAVKLYRVWKANLTLKLKLRLYVSGACSILTYGPEA